jgi:cytochrome P450
VNETRTVGCPVVHGPASAHLTPTGCPVSQRAAEFDPFGDGYQQDPPEYVRWAREQEPVFWSPQLGYWVVTRYAAVKAIFRDNITFSPRVALEKITPTGPEANAVLASYGFALNRTLVNEDEPAHMPRRRALMAPFTPEALRHHEPMVRRLTRTYVDRFVDAGRVDLVDALLWEVPLTVALHFLGIAEDDMELLRRYSIAHTINTWGRPKPEEQVAVAHAVGNFWQLAGVLLEKMRRDPDAAGWMQYAIRKQKELPEVVTDSYLHSMMMAIIVAAHETTANAGANAIKLLLQHPQAWQELCADPRLIPNAVEECLRHNGSVAAWRRLATRDVTIDGVDIPAGSRLLIVTASANHDERAFADADLFDIRRENANDHLTFGYGSHQCMGKNLARMEIQVFLQELTRRLPHLKLAEQRFSYVANTSFRGPEHLWVEWDPDANPERTNPSLREGSAPVRIGEPSKRDLARVLVVERVDRAAEGIVRVRLVAPDGGDLPRWTPGSHVDVECGDTGLARPYSLCGDPRDAGAYEIAVLREAESRGGSAWLHANVRAGRPAPRRRAAQPFPARRVGTSARVHRRRDRHHADRGDGAAGARARRRLRLALQRPSAHLDGARRRARRAARRTPAPARRRGRPPQRPRGAPARAGRRHRRPRLRSGTHARRDRGGDGALARRIAPCRALRHHGGPARSGARARLRGGARRLGAGAAGARRPDRPRRTPRRQHRRPQRLRRGPVRIVRGRRARRRDRPSRPRPDARGARRRPRMMACCSRARDAKLVLGL